MMMEENPIKEEELSDEVKILIITFRGVLEKWSQKVEK
jgi:hypothetical protein